jgi:uncharacterized protein YbaR (Trm112 family)
MTNESMANESMAEQRRAEQERIAAEKRESKRDRAKEETAASGPVRALDLLACPACYGSLQPEPLAAVCAGCGRRYPVRDGIPVLIVDQAALPV